MYKKNVDMYKKNVDVDIFSDFCWYFLDVQDRSNRSLF